MTDERMNTEDYLLRCEAEKVLHEAMKDYSTPGEQYLRAYVYLMHRTLQMIDEKIEIEKRANQKLIKTLNETNKLLKNLNTEFEKIRKSQENLERYFHMIVRKEAGTR